MTDAGHSAVPGAGGATITIRARLFAMQRELAGTNRLELELPAGADIEAAWAALVERYPALASGRVAVRFARNGEYAEPDERLADGDEVAFIPPVSGGSDVPLRIIEIRETPLALAELEALGERLASDGDGAIVGFVGRTRVTPGTPAPGQEAAAAVHSGRAVRALDYEAHEPMARRVLDGIADEIAERFGVVRLAIVHRVGVVGLGEVSIVVVAVSPHRDAAFAAARYAIDETKARAPIWKAERFADGHVWIGEPARSVPTGSTKDR